MRCITCTRARVRSTMLWIHALRDDAGRVRVRTGVVL